MFFQQLVNMINQNFQLHYRKYLKKCFQKNNFRELNQIYNDNQYILQCFLVFAILVVFRKNNSAAAADADDDDEAKISDTHDNVDSDNDDDIDNNDADNNGNDDDTEDDAPDIMLMMIVMERQ